MDDFEFFNSRYHYDPVDGQLRTKIPMKGHGGCIPIGSIAGSVREKPDRRIVLHINRDGRSRIYKVHRAIWLLMTGSWPTREIDHVDLDGTNNRWDNLRLSTSSQNKMNQGKRSDNSSGFKGVSWEKGKWLAKIQINRKRIYLGRYDRKEDAFAAYSAASVHYHREFGRLA